MLRARGARVSRELYEAHAGRGKLRGETPVIQTIRYYDAVNFARLVTVPGFYTWGYNDNTVPPTSSWIAYNEIRAPKEKFIVPEAVHAVTPAQREHTRDWIMKALHP